MRKLTVLLLAGALLVITGGTSVAGGKDFALLFCGTAEDPPVDVARFDASIDMPAECARTYSCSGCAKALTDVGMKLVDTLVTPDLLMIFSTKKRVRDD